MLCHNCARKDDYVKIEGKHQMLHEINRKVLRRNVHSLRNSKTFLVGKLLKRGKNSSAVKSENVNPPLRLAVDHVFRDLTTLAVR